MLDQIMVDTHTHTVLSGHAWSTLRENAVAAASRGLAAMCLTEHGHALPGAGPWFLAGAQRMLPERVAGVRVYYGIEANVVDLDGAVDIEDRILRICEWVVASMHDICMEPGDEAANTRAFQKTLAHPAIDMLGHIDDIRTACDFRAVAAEAARLGKVIEINNNSIRARKADRVRAVAEACGELGVRVAVSSDAHFDDMIGAVDPALAILREIKFPEELVINRSQEAFESYLAERRQRLGK
ncbi:MAG: PHP domain-containing protein [Planctomycetaceae bacterium]|nr:PHP domain-containing protein [Planctomycetaceae bacterium]